MLDGTQLKGRFSFASLSRYIPIIEQAMAAFPNDFVFKPSGLSVETVRARLGDAIKVFSEYAFPGVELDREKLKEWRTHIVISLLPNGAIRVGQRLQKGVTALTYQAKIETPSVTALRNLEVSTDSWMVFQGCVWLLKYKVLTEAVKFSVLPRNDKGQAIPFEVLAEYASEHGCEFFLDPATQEPSWILL